MDSELISLFALRAQFDSYNPDHTVKIKSVDKAINERIMIVAGKLTLDKIGNRVRVAKGATIIPSDENPHLCDCSTTSHAHSVNCPKHPANQLEPVGYK